MVDGTTEAGTPAAATVDRVPAVATDERKDTGQWRTRITACKERKATDFVPEWQRNVDYRKVRPFDATLEDTDRVAIPVDWTQTKAKQAQLFSQVPTVMLTPKAQQVSAAVPPFAKKLNDTIVASGVGVAMDECLPDAINAAGIGAVLVGYETRQRMKKVPKVDTKLMPPEAVAQVMQTPELVEEVPEVVDRRFYARRISPASLLWPAEFVGSDFNDAPWLGYSGKMLWSQAQVAFNLKDEDKSKIVGTTSQGGAQRDVKTVSTMTDRFKTSDDEDIVEFDELYYWTWRFDPACTSFCQLHRLVFVNGLEQPAVDEPYQGQKATQDGRGYVGVVRNPIQVLTLTYISDEAIPPSDSSVGRAQVDELMKSRSQMVQQRDHSIPMRWFDVNRADPTIIDQLMRGTWQGMIPVNGNGDKAIGEVARAQYPNQNFDFDRTIKDDLQQAWQVGPNQSGDFNEGERSASEANIVQANFQTRIGYERARVSAFFLAIAECLAGLLALFGDFDTPDVGQQELQRLESWDRFAIAQKFVYTIRTDSTVLLDANQRLKKLKNLLDITAKSGFVDIEPIIREMVALSGLDPDQIVKKPNPKGPEPPNVSISVNKEDVHDPILLAMLLKAGYGPGPDDMDAAKKLLVNSVEAPKPPAPPMPPPGGPGGPGGPPPPLPPKPGGPNPQVVEDRMPDFNMMSRVNQRKDSGLD